MVQKHYQAVKSPHANMNVPGDTSKLGIAHSNIQTSQNYPFLFVIGSINALVSIPLSQ